MAISRYNRPAELNLIDTYVPLPFREIKQAITEKQDLYDQTEDTFNKAPLILGNLNVNKDWVDAYGNTVGKNIGYDIVEAKKAQAQQEQQAFFEKYKGDWSSPEAQREIRNWAANLGAWYENIGKPLQAKSNAYFKAREEAGKKKNQMGFQDTYHGFNNLIYNEAKKSAEGKVDFDWQDPTYNEYLDKAEAVNKATTNLGAIVKEWSGGRKVDLSQLTAQEFKTFKDSNATQIASAKKALLSQLEQKHRQEAYELARQLAPSQGKSPEEFYAQYGKELKNRLDSEVSNLFDAKLNIHKKDLTDYSNLSKDQLGLFGLGENGQPLFIERSTQVGGEVTGMEPIDFNNIDESKDSLNDFYNNQPFRSLKNTVDLPYMNNKSKWNFKGYMVYDDADKTLNSAKDYYNSIKDPKEKELVKKDINNLESFIAKRESFNNNLEKAKKGDWQAAHKYFEETNPVYKNTTYAYAKENGKLGKTLTHDDIKQIQAISNRNLQTIQANQEVTLDPTYDKEAINNAVNSIINGNAVIRDDKGTIITQEDFNEIQNEALPDNQKTTENKKKLLESGLTTFITPVGRKEAGYKLTIDGKNYHVTYPNSEAVPKFRQFQKITENVYNPNTPPEVKIESVPEEVINVVNAGIETHLGNKDIKDVSFFTVRNDYNINDSYLKASIVYEENGDLKTQNFEIPIFPKTSKGKKVTNISNLSTEINPQTGGYQDMKRYTSQDSGSLKYLQAE